MHQCMPQLVTAHGAPCPPRLLRVQYFPRIPPHHRCLVSNRGTCQPVALLAVVARLLHHCLQPHALRNCPLHNGEGPDIGLADNLPLPGVAHTGWHGVLLLYSWVAAGGSVAQCRGKEDGVRVVMVETLTFLECFLLIVSIKKTDKI